MHVTLSSFYTEIIIWKQVILIRCKGRILWENGAAILHELPDRQALFDSDNKFMPEK